MDTENAGIFIKVAETGSFRRAADELGYTQAGISYIIAAMERETGLHLFTREHGGVRLTAEGEALLPAMHRLENWQRRFRQTAGELNGLKTGSVRVLIFDSISIHWIPGIVRRFHDDYPGVNIELISEEDSMRAEQMVLSGEVDCAFFLTKVKSRMDVFPLIEESLLAIVSPDHPLASAPCFPIKKLADYPYISMKYDNHTGIANIFRSHGLEPATAFRMDNDYAAMAMVSKGLGYCIFPELLLMDVPYELVSLEFDEPQHRTISIGTADVHTCSRACRKFIEYTRDWVAANTKIDRNPIIK